MHLNIIKNICIKCPSFFPTEKCKKDATISYINSIMQKVTHSKWTLKFGFYLRDFIKSNNLFKDLLTHLDRYGHLKVIVFLWDCHMIFRKICNMNETFLRQINSTRHYHLVYQTKIIKIKRDVHK